MNAREIIQRAGIDDDKMQRLAAVTMGGKSTYQNVYVQLLMDSTGLDEESVRWAARTLRLEVRKRYADYVPVLYGGKSIEEIAESVKQNG